MGRSMKIGEPRFCQYCNTPLIRNKYPNSLEDFTSFSQRKYCDAQCMAQAMQGEKTQRKQVREVRIDNDSFNSPHRRGYTEQCSCEFDDIVCELSSEIELGEWKRNSEKAENILFNLWKESRGERFLHEPLSALYEIWRSVTDKEIGSFRRHYHKRDEHRVQKLKALGNAIVPQVAFAIMQAIIEVDNETKKITQANP